MSKKIQIARVSEFAPGQYRSVEIDGERIALFNIDGEFYALQDTCTHDGGILTGGTLQGYSVECPRHGARFDVRTGAVMRLPAYIGVKTYPVSIEEDAIFVILE
jgi:3-phenylpropionate/trans-cinnamate dioxygenase ferredoxin subunit